MPRILFSEQATSEPSGYVSEVIDCSGFDSILVQFLPYIVNAQLDIIFRNLATNELSIPEGNIQVSRSYDVVAGAFFQAAIPVLGEYCFLRRLTAGGAAQQFDWEVLGINGIQDKPIPYLSDPLISEPGAVFGIGNHQRIGLFPYWGPAILHITATAGADYIAELQSMNYLSLGIVHHGVIQQAGGGYLGQQILVYLPPRIVRLNMNVTVAASMSITLTPLF